MSQSPAPWTPLESGLSIVSTGRPLQVELLSPSAGRLCLRCAGGEREIPPGPLSLLLSNWPETCHWQRPAEALGDGRIAIDLTGVEAALQPEDPRPLRLHLVDGQQVLYSLVSEALAPRLRKSARSLYLFDKRDLWGEPVASFYREDCFYEALPYFYQDGKHPPELGLHLTPRSLRYWQQLTYGLTEWSLEEEPFRLCAQAPSGAPALDGFALHRPDGREEGALFLPAAADADGHYTAALSRLQLPVDGRTLALSGVISVGDGVFCYVPLSVLGDGLNRSLEYLANGVPLREADGVRCYLSLDQLCHPTLISGTTLPNAQRPDGKPAPLNEMLEDGRLPVYGHCAIRDLGGENWLWHFEVPNFSFAPSDELCLVAEFKSVALRLPVRLLDGGRHSGLLEADLTALRDGLQNSLITRWQLSLAVRQGDIYYHVQLRLPERTIRSQFREDEYLDRTFAYGAPVGETPLGRQTVIALICCPFAGYCQIQTSDRMRRYERQLVCRAKVIRLRGRRLELRVVCPETVPGRWTGFAILHRYKLEVDRAVYSFSAQAKPGPAGSTVLTASLDLSECRFSPLYWDIRAVFEGQDGVSYTVRIRAEVVQGNWRRQANRVLQRLERTFHSGSYRQDEAQSVSLYRTADSNYALVCQEYSPYSGLLFRLKERLALLLSRVFARPLAKKSIFLCYEKYCCMAQDNGFYFFRHCMEHDMERTMRRNIYFVIDKRQPDYRERLLPYRDHVIQFMSLRHMVYILAARLLISSDSKAHAYAWRAKESIILPRVMNRKKLVFLQHGVIALKRVEFYSKGTNAVSLFVTSNQREHDIIVEEMAYPPEDVIITGLARWDVLEDAGWQERHVLVMPTWRNWLEEVSDAVFVTSDYYRNYMALLNDPRLATLLEREDLYLDFYIHPKFRDYLSNFHIAGGGRVRLIPFGSEPLNRLIMGCKLLITDYSSVCWDVYYQAKPVLFYQFDLEQYNETTGSYIDMETELFGERVLTPEALLERLEAYAKDGFRLPEKYAAMRAQRYAYLDHNNSQRICEEIMKRNW